MISSHPTRARTRAARGHTDRLRILCRVNQGCLFTGGRCTHRCDISNHQQEVWFEPCPQFSANACFQNVLDLQLRFPDAAPLMLRLQASRFKAMMEEADVPHTFDLLTETTQVGVYIAAVLLLLFRLVLNFKCLAEAVRLAKWMQGCQLEGLMQQSAAHSGVFAGIEDLNPSVGDIHVSMYRYMSPALQPSAGNIVMGCIGVPLSSSWPVLTIDTPCPRRTLSRPLGRACARWHLGCAQRRWCVAPASTAAWQRCCSTRWRTMWHITARSLWCCCQTPGSRCHAPCLKPLIALLSFLQGAWVTPITLKNHAIACFGGGSHFEPEGP